MSTKRLNFHQPFPSETNVQGTGWWNNQATNRERRERERVRNSQFSNLNTTEECYRCHDSGKLGRAGPGDIPVCQQMLNTCPHTQPGTPDDHDRQLSHEAWQEVEIYFSLPFSVLFCLVLSFFFFFKVVLYTFGGTTTGNDKKNHGFGKEKHQQPPSKTNCGAEGERIHPIPYSLIHRRF